MLAQKQDNLDYDVVIVGAGISGINFAYRLQERNPDLSFTILEGRHEIGGTWSLFQYPGIRSDSDLYTFGFPWRPWNEVQSIAEGPRIINYMKESARIAGIDKKVQLHHKVEQASWRDEEKAWTFNVDYKGSNGEWGNKKMLRSRFMLMCTGYYDYNQPLQTTIPGIEKFEGRVVHPQFWPRDLDYTGKNVVIVGSGATAVTLLPSMTKTASHVTMLQRSPSYLLSTPTEDKLEKTIRKYCSQTWQDRLIRWKWLILPFIFTRFCYFFPNAARKAVSGAIAKSIPKDMSMEHFTPRYNVFEQRLCFCPDADFYKALRKGTGSVETGTIETVTEKSIKLNGGKELNPDIIVTATGLKLQIGGGMKILVNGQETKPGEKFVWKGVMLEDVPNLAFVIGYVDASWTLGADATAQLVCRMFKQMQKEKAVEIVPRRTEREKQSMQEAPLLRMTSTYIQKAKDVIPKTGNTGPWQARSYYFKDIMIAWFGDIKSGMEWIRAV